MLKKGREQRETPDGSAAGELNLHRFGVETTWLSGKGRGRGEFKEKGIWYD